MPTDYDLTTEDKEMMLDMDISESDFDKLNLDKKADMEIASGLEL